MEEMHYYLSFKECVNFIRHLPNMGGPWSFQQVKKQIIWQHHEITWFSQESVRLSIVDSFSKREKDSEG